MKSHETFSDISRKKTEKRQNQRWRLLPVYFSPWQQRQFLLNYFNKFTAECAALSLSLLTELSVAHSAVSIFLAFSQVVARDITTNRGSWGWAANFGPPKIYCLKQIIMDFDILFVFHMYLFSVISLIAGNQMGVFFLSLCCHIFSSNPY